MYNSKFKRKQSEKQDSFKLVPVYQRRVQNGIEKKKMRRWQKSREILRDGCWEMYDKQVNNSSLQNDSFLQLKQSSSSFPSIYSSNQLTQNKIYMKKQIKISDIRNYQKTRESIQNAHISKFYFSKFMEVQFIAVLLTILSFFLNIIYTQTNQQEQEILVLNATSGITFALMIVIVCRYYYDLELQKSQKIIKFSGGFATKLVRSGNLIPMILELFIIIIHPNNLLLNLEVRQLESYTLISIQHQVNHMLSALLSIRIYIIFRGLISRTIYYSPRASRLCRLHFCDHDIMFSIKCILKQTPFQAIVIMFGVLLYAFSHALKLSEQTLNVIEANPATDLSNYPNCLWCILVTMATLGYGDYFPRTFPGRIVIILASIVGMFLSPALIVALSAELSLQSSEHKSHICIQRLRLQKLLSQEASKAALTVISLGQAKKGTQNFLDSKQELIKFQTMYQQLKNFITNTKNHMRQIKSTIDTNNLYQQMQRYFTILKSNFNEIYNRQRNIRKVLLQIAQLESGDELNVINFAHTLQEKILDR